MTNDRSQWSRAAFCGRWVLVRQRQRSYHPPATPAAIPLKHLMKRRARYRRTRLISRPITASIAICQ